PAHLYVFQSIMVACSIGVYRCSVPLVLGKNKIEALGRAMGSIGLAGRLDGKCLLSQCYSPDFSRAGNRSSFAGETARLRPANCPDSRIGASLRRACRGFFGIAFPHFYYAADHLRKPL